MKGLFQCPPWARSFCPFRACCFWSFWAFSPYLNYMGKFSQLLKNSIVFLLANIEKKIHTADKAAGSLSRFKGRWQKIKIL